MRAARPPSTAHTAGRLRSPRASRAAVQAPPASASKPWSWLGHVAAVLAAATLITTLFGYGVLMGLAQPLGLDHNLLINAPLDPILAAWAGVLGMFPKTMTWASLVRIYTTGPWPTVIAILLAILLGLALVIQFGARRAALKWAQRTKARVRSAERPDEAALIAAMVGAGVAVALGPLLVWIGLTLTLVAVAIVPVMGYFGAEDYVERYVLPATQCFDPTQPANAEANAKALPCVTLQPADKAGAEPKTGVIVIATSAYALLYHPATRLAERVPVQNVTVQTQRPAPLAK